LRELDDERAAGRIGVAEYEDLKRRDEAQAARAILELEALDAAAKSAKAGRKGVARKTKAGTDVTREESDRRSPGLEAPLFSR